MIVGFAGRAGSGKDTSADFLVKNHGFVKVAFADEIKRTCARLFPRMTRDHLWGPSDMRNVALTDYSRPHGPWIRVGEEERCACCNVGRFSDELLQQQCYLTARFACQYLGTEFGRLCYPSTWTDITMKAAARLMGWSASPVTFTYTPWHGLSPIPSEAPRPRGIVISDLRWPTGNEGTAIREAGGILVTLKRGDGLAGATGAHESEKAVSETPDSFYDEVIDNREYTLEQLDEHLGKLAKKYSERRKVSTNE